MRCVRCGHRTRLKNGLAACKNCGSIILNKPQSQKFGEAMTDEVNKLFQWENPELLEKK